MLKVLYEDALELKVVGIIRPNADAETTMLTGSIGYTHELTKHIIEMAEQSAVVQAQKASPTVDVLTGLPFKSNTGALEETQKQENFLSYIDELTDAELAEVYVEIQALNAIRAQLQTQVDAVMETMQDRDALIAQVSSAMAEQVGLDAAQIEEYLAEMTLEDLKEMMRPAIE